MTTRLRPAVLTVVAFAAAGIPGLFAAARVLSDVQPPQRRQATLDLAQGLARRPDPEPLPADLASPYNPPGFDRPDPAAAQAAAAAPAASAAAAPAAAAPATPRETLEAIAAQIAPSGTMIVRGKPRLFIAGRPFEVGTRFTATYNNEDHELELVSIDRTTFTLRYRGEDVTRPIKPAR